MSLQLGKFQPGDIVIGKIIKLENTGVLVDFDTDRPVRVPLLELSLNEIKIPEDAVQLNEAREFLVVGNYDGKHDIFFSHCSPETLKMRHDLCETACDLASRQCDRPVNKENIILHTKIVGIGAGGVSARLQWFLCSEDRPPTVSFSIRQLEIRKAWERVRQLQDEDATLRATIIKKYQRSATVKVEGLRASIHTYVDKHKEELVEGEELPLKIIEVREDYERLVLVHNSVWFRLKQLQIGQVVSGTIRSVRDYGVLVDIGDLYALMPTSKIIHSSIEHPSQIFKVNAHLEATIIKLDIERGRVVIESLDN